MSSSSTTSTMESRSPALDINSTPAHNFISLNANTPSSSTPDLVARANIKTLDNVDERSEEPAEDLLSFQECEEECRSIDDGTTNSSYAAKVKHKKKEKYIQQEFPDGSTKILRIDSKNYRRNSRSISAARVKKDKSQNAKSPTAISTGTSVISVATTPTSSVEYDSARSYTEMITRIKEKQKTPKVAGSSGSATDGGASSKPGSNKFNTPTSSPRGAAAPAVPGTSSPGSTEMNYDDTSKPAIDLNAVTLKQDAAPGDYVGNKNIIVIPENSNSEVASDTTSNSSVSNLAQHLETMHAGLKNAQFLKSAVYGGIDGVITTFSIISSAHGAHLSYGVTVTLGIANVLADGFSMGFGDFISGKLEKSFVEGEKQKEVTEFRKKPEHEKAEMVEMLREREQMEEDDAKQLVAIMGKYEHLFIDNMMRYELNLEAETESECDLVKNGVATFWSFLVFGALPLYVYLLGFAWEEEDRDINVVYIVACVVSAVALFCVGAISAFLVKQSWDKILQNGLFTLLNGAVAGTLSYFVGFAFEQMLISRL
ncbi:unnamed protein product [Amoebophrya sp. A120]|nr:unnamed protein product [Amoebophrya sp. A120]|eukprot:GSA120T00013917001.1